MLWNICKLLRINKVQNLLSSWECIYTPWTLSFSEKVIRDKYPLHIINKMISVVGLLRNFLYIYKCKEIHYKIS
jgi:hypothetical protein